jgi:hypothetical protein
VRTLHIGLRAASVALCRELGYEVIRTVAETPIGHLTMMKLPSDEFTPRDRALGLDGGEVRGGVSGMRIRTGLRKTTRKTLR